MGRARRHDRPTFDTLGPKLAANAAQACVDDIIARIWAH